MCNLQQDGSGFYLSDLSLQNLEKDRATKSNDAPETAVHQNVASDENGDRQAAIAKDGPPRCGQLSCQGKTALRLVLCDVLSAVQIPVHFFDLPLECVCFCFADAKGDFS